MNEITILTLTAEQKIEFYEKLFKLKSDVVSITFLHDGIEYRRYGKKNYEFVSYEQISYWKITKVN